MVDWLTERWLDRLADGRMDRLDRPTDGRMHRLDRLTDGEWRVGLTDCLTNGITDGLY